MILILTTNYNSHLNILWCSGAVEFLVPTWMIFFLITWVCGCVRRRSAILITLNPISNSLATRLLGEQFKSLVIFNDLDTLNPLLWCSRTDLLLYWNNYLIDNFQQTRFLSPTGTYNTFTTFVWEFESFYLVRKRQNSGKETKFKCSFNGFYYTLN